jgi:hypothetical protein
MVSEAQKRANLKWRELNKEKYLAKQREYQSKYYEQNSHKILEHKKEFYINVLKPRKDAKKQLQQSESTSPEAGL